MLIVGVVVGLAAGLVEGLPNGLIIGLVGGLLYGGLACIQHAVLRFILSGKRYIPWKLVPFLDYCADRILLRKVGGGYIFIHRMLMEYFAELDTAAAQEVASTQTK